MSDVFSGRLKGILDARNLQQKAVAASLGVSPAVFSAWVKSKSEPSFDMLAQICRELCVSSDYLLGLVDSIEAPNTIPVSISKSSVQRDPLAGLSPKDRDAVLQIIAGLPKTYADTSSEEDLPIEALGFEF